MIVETTLFWNEAHYFKERVLHTLSYADFLLISESPDSFSGKISRPLRVPGLIATLPEEAQKKVIFVEVNLKPMASASAEDRDAFVRDSGLQYLKKNASQHGIPFAGTTLVATDFDEFLFPERIREISSWLHRFPWRTYIHFRQRLTYYFLNYQVVGKNSDWIRPFACRLGWAIRNSISVHKQRNRKSRKIVKSYTGWHHSYLGGKEFILEKVKSFAHADDPAFKGQTEEDRVKNFLDRKDLYSRDMNFEKLDDYATTGIEMLKTRKDLFLS